MEEKLEGRISVTRKEFPKLDFQQIEMIRALDDFDGHIGRACEAVGIHRTTYWRWTKQEEFTEALDLHRAAVVSMARSEIIKQAREGSFQAAKFLIERYEPKIPGTEEVKVQIFPGINLDIE